ncbi:MAG: MBL fold metallo-hydrolase [Clostridium sp.]|nr:MBL fold metallo-hydrolase [Clostridium sp.]MCM1398457.1 MBL fold metallo-hydrolase [Clostridium sp.]MCM1460179.1 MBL fold metallo-hydrolase [Bacteroides sp.]
MSEFIELLKNPIRETMSSYYGDKRILLLMAVCFFYLLLASKELRRKLVYPTILMAVVIVNPVLYKYIFSKVVYKRMFWVIADVVVIPTAAVRLIQDCRKKWQKAIVGIVSALAVIFAGNIVYSHENYVRIQNLEKLSDTTKGVCDIMLAYDDSPRCILPVEIAVEARVYNGNIEPMFGRDCYGFIMSADARKRALAKSIDSAAPDYEKILFYARAEERGFVVAGDNKPISRELLEKYGYSQIGSYGKYTIYYCASETDDDMGWMVTQLASYEVGNRLLHRYVIEDSEEHLIVIDGGTARGCTTLMQYIQDHGGSVDAWIITSYAPESAGAFAYLMGKYDIDIKCLYVPAVSEEEYKAVATQKQWSLYETCKPFFGRADMVQQLKQGDTVDIYGLKVDVLSDLVVKNGEKTGRGAMTLALTGREETMLYCSVAGTRTKTLLAGISDDYNIKYIQLANSGRVLTGETYHALKPEAVFIDASESFMETKKGENSYSIKTYFKEQGVTVYQFDTCPNSVYIR